MLDKYNIFTSKIHLKKDDPKFRAITLSKRNIQEKKLSSRVIRFPSTENHSINTI